MGDVSEKVIAVALTLPEMESVLCRFVRTIFVEIFKKAEYDDFADFKLEVFSGQKNLVVGDIGQHALFICGQTLLNVNPLQFRQNDVRSGSA